MFEDEMTEEHLARTAEEYERVTIGERHEERLARAQAYIRALEAHIAWLKREHADAWRDHFEYADTEIG
jgi:hypothetical protein